VFAFFIKKFNLSTPGRNGNVTLTTKEDYNAQKNKQDSKSGSNANSRFAPVSEIINALGGIENIDAVDACITRLRISLINPALMADDEVWKKSLGASGVIKRGNGVQIIYGAQANVYKMEIEDHIT